jgi:hypothetical protein
VGKRHFCIKIAVFRISVGSLIDIKKTYLSLTFQYLNDLCLTNLKRLSLSAILNTAIFIQKCLFPTWNDIAFTVFIIVTT